MNNKKRHLRNIIIATLVLIAYVLLWSYNTKALASILTVLLAGCLISDIYRK